MTPPVLRKDPVNTSKPEKGKPSERAGRKARGLNPQGHGSPAASVSISVFLKKGE